MVIYSNRKQMNGWEWGGGARKADRLQWSKRKLLRVISVFTVLLVVMLSFII